MNWEQVYKIYSEMKELEKQRGYLNDLARQIADDRKAIHVAIRHDTFKPPRQTGYGLLDMMYGQAEESQNSVDIEPVTLTLKDEKALAYIGQQLYFIDELIETLNEKLEML